MSKTYTKSYNVSFLGLLAILFIGLKLTDHIDWSWWWVLAPLWVLPAVLLAIGGLVLGAAAWAGR